MSTWQEDITRTLRYQEAYQRTHSAYAMGLRFVADFVLEGYEVDCDGLAPLYSDSAERLVMRAKGCDLADAKRIVSRRYPERQDEEW